MTPSFTSAAQQACLEKQELFAQPKANDAETEQNPDGPQTFCQTLFSPANVLKFFAGGYADSDRSYPIDALVIHAFGACHPPHWAFHAEGIETVKETLRMMYPPLENWNHPYSAIPKSPQIWEQAARMLKLPEQMPFPSINQAIRRWDAQGGIPIPRTYSETLTP